MQHVSVCLWLNGQAQEAARFYTSLVDDGRLLTEHAAPVGTPSTEPGALLVAEFELNGQRFMALNGGKRFPFTAACSIVLSVDTQEEVDRLWDTLTSNGGAEGHSGWCTDRFGLSWQIVPRRLDELLADPNPQRAGRTMKAMLDMRKLVIADLEAAAAGRRKSGA